jgi:hypothetical protein
MRLMSETWTLSQDRHTVSILPAQEGAIVLEASPDQKASALGAAASPAVLDQVTVTAPQLTEQQLEALSAAFVRSHTLSSVASGHVARWNVPVCPLVMGL